jgi:hypothetical protein
MTILARGACNGAHRRDGVAVASQQFPARGGRIQHREAGTWPRRSEGEGYGASNGQTHARRRKSVKGGTWRLLNRNREENRGVRSRALRGEKDGRGGTSGSCAGVAETGAGRVVSDAVRKEGSWRRAWAVRE